jgi:hypothetical protein
MKYCANNIHEHAHVVEWIRALDALIPVQGRNVQFFASDTFHGSSLVTSHTVNDRELFLSVRLWA